MVVAWVGAAPVTEAGYSRRSLQDHEIVVGKELLVTAPEVVDSNLARYPGAWSFGHLMEEVFGRENAPRVVAQWLEHWAEGAEPRPEKRDPGLPSRAGIRTRLIAPWQERDGHESGAWTPNLANAPFRLLAIANRSDLSKPLPDILNPPEQAVPRGGGVWGGGNGLVNADGGEARLVFGAIGPDGQPLEGGLTVIFEYGVDVQERQGFFDWVRAWHALGRHETFGPGYCADLERVTRAFTDRRKEAVKAPKGEPNSCRELVQRYLSDAGRGSQLLRVRVNDGVGGELREFREFSIEGEKGLKPARLPGTPREEFFRKGTPENRVLARWLKDQVGKESTPALARDRVGSTLPHSFPLPDRLRVRGELLPVAAVVAPVPDNDAKFHWDGYALHNTRLRRAFSTQTCCGCHCGDTNTEFFHVAPRAEGEAAALSKFLRTDGSRWRPKDPDQGSGFASNEIEDRVQLFEAALNPRLRISDVERLRSTRAGRAH